MKKERKSSIGSFLGTIVIVLAVIFIGGKMYDKYSNLQTKKKDLKIEQLELQLDSKTNEMEAAKVQYVQNRNQEVDLENTRNRNKLLTDQVQTLTNENIRLKQENQRLRENMMSQNNSNSSTMNDQSIKEDLAYLKENCRPKEVIKEVYVERIKAPKKKRVQKKRSFSYQWSCRDKKMYHQCTHDKSRLWDLTCNGVPKYITTEESVKYSKKSKQYKASENLYVKEKNYITEVTPGAKILNPDLDPMCLKSKHLIPSECSNLYCK